MEIKKDILYTKEHEWVKIDGNIATIGITDFAQSELGDIVFIEVEHVDETVEVDDVFGTIEAVKTVSDLFMPITGKIIAFNDALNDAPESINSSPFDEGWIIKVEFDVDDLSGLLTAKEYEALIA